MTKACGMMHIPLTTATFRCVMRLAWMALALSAPTSHGASLFGDHSCASWHQLEYAEKRTWTNAFLAPLSLTLKGLQKSKTDQYNDNPKAHEAAIIGIDAFCSNHPDLGAADGAGRYLNKLIEMPSN